MTATEPVPTENFDPTDAFTRELSHDPAAFARHFGRMETEPDIYDAHIKAAAENFASSAVAQDPRAAANLQTWGKVAPTLPKGALLTFAITGTTPDSPVGQWAISNVANAHQQQHDQAWASQIVAHGDPHGPDYQNALDVLTSATDPGQSDVGVYNPTGINPGEIAPLLDTLKNPQRLAMLQTLPVDQQTRILSLPAGALAALDDKQFAQTLATGQLPEDGGLTAKVLGPVVTGTRYGFAGLQAGYEALQADLRFSQAGHDALGLPSIGKGHETSSLTAASDIVGQTTLGQMLRGKSSGSGFLPGGEASQAQADAARAAASINGHALTPGRSLASDVFQPDTIPYQIMSGATDAFVAMKGDPAQVAISHLSDLAKERKLFGITTEEAKAATANHLIDVLGPDNAKAIQEWAGLQAPEARYGGAIARTAAANAGQDLRSAVIDKLTKDPGSLRELVDNGTIDAKSLMHDIVAPKVGIATGLRRYFDQPTALTALNSDEGAQWVNDLAKNNGLSIFSSGRGKIPADVAWKLGEATSPEQVRAVLTDALGTDVRSVPFGWGHSFDDLRYVSKLPNKFVDSTDPNMMVDHAMRALKLGKVPTAEWDGLLRPLALSDGNRALALKPYTAVWNRVGQSILEHDPEYQKFLPDYQAGLNAIANGGQETPEFTALRSQVKGAQRIASQLTRLFPEGSEADRLWSTDYITGNAPYARGLTVGGDPMMMDGPTAVAELLNRGFPAPDTETVRNIRKAVSSMNWYWRMGVSDENRLAPILGTDKLGFGHAQKVAPYIADSLTKVYKTLTLARAALPVRFLADEQARMATAGLDSMFHNPMSYIAWVVGGKLGTEDAGKGLTNVLGDTWWKDLGDHNSMYRRAVGTSSRLADALARPEQILAKGWTSYTPEHSRFAEHWADRISFAHNDATTRAVAQAITDPETTGGLDAVKQSLWDGNLAPQRQTLIDSHLKFSPALAARDGSDAYVDYLAHTKLHDLTGGNQELIDAVAGGEPFAKEKIDRQFIAKLRDLADAGESPARVTGPVQFDMKAGGQYLKRATNFMFSALMDAPSTKLTRSPTFRQAYWQRIEELFPYMNDAARQGAVEEGARNGVRLDINGARNAVGDALTGAEADTIAKAHGLQFTHDLLYYPGEHTAVTDRLRAVAPFADAWRNVLGTWSKLLVQNPEVVRRVQQGVVAARQSGWWHTDPQSGEEVFTFVPGPVTKWFTGAAPLIGAGGPGLPFPITAKVSGLNIVGTGLPGVGPAITWPASSFFSAFNVPGETAISNYLMPYGNPDWTGGTFESLFPGWLQKFKATGLLGNLPGGQASPEQQNTFDNNKKLAYQYLVSTGQFDLSANSPDHDKLMHLSDEYATRLSILRGMSQFVSPSAPSFTPETQLKDGSLIETWKLAQDYKKILDANHGDSYQATLDAVAKYGPERIFALGSGTYGQPFTQPQVYGLPTTAETQIFRARHGDFAADFPKVYGFWVPPSSQFDYTEYVRQIQSGERKPLNVDTWSRLADARLGNAIYSTLRAQMGPKISPAEQEWLNAQKAKIAQEHPGFGDQEITPSSNTLQGTIDGDRGLRAAATNPAVRDQPISKAILTYLGLRDQMIANAKAGGTTLTSARAEPLRQWLYEQGNALASQAPAFTNVWNDLLAHEVEPAQPSSAPTSAADQVTP